MVTAADSEDIPAEVDQGMRAVVVHQGSSVASNLVVRGWERSPEASDRCRRPGPGSSCRMVLLGWHCWCGCT